MAVRLPGDVVQASRLQEGERVEVEVDGGEIVISRIDPQIALEKLFRGKTADEWRALYAGAFDWGPDVGREIVPE